MITLKHNKYFTRISLIISILVLAFSLNSCEKMLEIYIGFPLQPENINSEYVPGLNIFGMCKAGTTLDEYNQYFEVHLIPHLFDTISDVSYEDAHITIRKDFREYTLFHQGDGIYLNQTITFNPGDEWTYACIADTFKITSATKIPNMPSVVLSTMNLKGSTLNFTIQADNSAYLYDIAYVDQLGYATKRVIPNKGEDTAVDIEIEYNESSPVNYLYVIAYDENYERYITTSNIFFKPNAYRPRFSTVDGGYGCFGSLTSLEVNIKPLIKR